MKKNRLHRLIATAALCAAALLPAHAQTAPKIKPAGPAPEALLWVGNSFFYYNNSLHNHYGQLVRAANAGRTRSTSVTVSGSGLDWHDMESLVRPDGLGRYSFVGDNEIRFNPPGRQYDVAIMMDCSQCPVHPQLQPVFHATAKKHSATLVKAGIKPMLFMSWAYKDKPDMINGLAEQYTIAGNTNDALVIPAGLAFTKVVQRKPEIELYEADKRHPSLAGTYLAAATVYATFYRQSPVGLKYTAGLPADVVSVLQNAAWDTVQEYFKP